MKGSGETKMSKELKKVEQLLENLLQEVSEESIWECGEGWCVTPDPGDLQEALPIVVVDEDYGERPILHAAMLPERDMRYWLLGLCWKLRHDSEAGKAVWQGRYEKGKAVFMEPGAFLEAFPSLDKYIVSEVDDEDDEENSCGEAQGRGLNI